MPIKTRNVEANIAKMGVEKGIKYSLVQVIEEQGAMREAIGNLADMMNQMADTLLQVTTVAHKQFDAAKKIERTLGLNDGGDEGAQSRDGS